MNERAGRRGGDATLWMLAGTAAALVLIGWLIYRAVWGFGGFYTHVRYIPVPANLIQDHATSLIDIDAYPRQARRYQANMTEEELIAFNQRELPLYGWQIVSEGRSILYPENWYCFAVERDQTRAYLRLGEGEKPQSATASVYLNVADDLCPIPNE